MRRYFTNTLLLSSAMALAIAAILYVVDPFAVMHPDDKTFYAVGDYLRVVKPYWAAHDYDTAVIGTSRSFRGLPPVVVAASYPDAKRVFNFSVGGARSWEARRFVDHMLAIAPVHRLIVEASSFLVHEREPMPQFSESRLAVSADGEPQPFWRYSDLARFLLSKSGLNKALAVMADADVRRLHRSDGYANPESENANWGRMIKTMSVHARRKVLTNALELEDLAHILTAACAKSVDVDLYFPAVHAYYLETLYQNSRKRLEGAKRDIAQLTLDAAKDCHGNARFQAWDFMVFNGITTEALPAPPGRMRYYEDTSHFTQEVGGMIAAVMAGGAIPDTGSGPLGLQLTPENVEAHLMEQQQARIAWHKANKKEMGVYNLIYLRENPARKRAKDARQKH